MAERLVVSADLCANLHPLLHRVVRATLGRDSEQDDVLQNTFLHILLGLARLRDPERLRAWAAAVAVNTARRELRRRVRRRRVFAELPLDSLALAYDHDLEAELCQGRARRALSAMPSEQREVLLLWLCGYGTVQDIADRVGCSLSTARRRLRAARRRLSKLSGAHSQSAAGPSARSA